MEIPNISKEGTFIRELKLVDNNPIYANNDSDKMVEVSINLFTTLTLSGREFRFMTLRDYRPICIHHFCYHSKWVDVLIFKDEGDIMAIGIEKVEITTSKMVYQLCGVSLSALLYALQLWRDYNDSKEY